MKNKKIILTLTIVLFLLVSQKGIASQIPLSGNQKLIISIDGNPVDFSIIGQPLLLKSGRTLVPERFFSKYLGYNGHNEDSRSHIWLNDEKTRLEIQLNDPVARVNGKAVEESLAYSYKDKNYLPLRFICEVFGERVDYKKLDGVHYIDITTKSNSQDLYESYYGDLDEPKPLAGYILIKDKRVYFNEVEIVEWKDQQRVKELGLNQKQMPNGYIIINKNKEIELYDLAEDASFTFTDINGLFVKEEEGNLIYTSSNLEDFLKHRSQNQLGDIPLSGQRIPYFIELEDGKIKSIKEEFKYTI